MTLEELRNKIINLEEDLTINPDNMYNIISSKAFEHFKTIEEYVLKELEYELKDGINRVINKNIPNLQTAIISGIHGDYHIERGIASLFNFNQANHKYDGTIFENGIFINNGNTKKTKLEINPILSIDKSKKETYIGIYPSPITTGFIFNKNKLQDKSSYYGFNELTITNFLTQELHINYTDYLKIKEYFNYTFPIIIEYICNNLIESINNTPLKEPVVTLTIPLVNVTNNKSIIIVLEYLYNELFSKDIFKDTILESVTTSITHEARKKFNTNLNSPLEREHKVNYCLRLMWNPYKLYKYLPKKKEVKALNLSSSK